MQLFDTHTHIDIALYDHDREAVLTRARKAGVSGQVVTGFIEEGWDAILKLCDREDDLFAAAGVHPLYTRHHRIEHLERLEDLCRANRLIAIGEIGLDFQQGREQEIEQMAFFEDQLDMACRFNLPVLLHVRRAHDEITSLMRKKNPPAGGIVHAFNGSIQQAFRYLDAGFYFGFGGTITYDRARKRRKVAAQLPLESIVLETDAPDMPPAAHHGQRNLPEYLVDIATALADIRQCAPALIAQQTTLNAHRILRITHEKTP